MSKFNKETQKSVRVVLPLTLYDEVKTHCNDYGDISRLVRHSLKAWLKEHRRAPIRDIYDEEELEKEDAKLGVDKLDSGDLDQPISLSRKGID